MFNTTKLVFRLFSSLLVLLVLAGNLANAQTSSPQTGLHLTPASNTWAHNETIKVRLKGFDLTAKTTTPMFRLGAGLVPPTGYDDEGYPYLELSRPEQYEVQGVLLPTDKSLTEETTEFYYYGIYEGAPVGTPTIIVSASAVCVGTPLSVSATGCNAYYYYTISPDPDGAESLTGTGDNYTFENAFPGSYTITFECSNTEPTQPNRIGGDKATTVNPSSSASTVVTVNEPPSVSFGPRSEPRLTCTTPSLPLFAANQSQSRTTNKSMAVSTVLSLTVVQPNLTTQTGNLDQSSSDPTAFTVNQAGSYTLLASNSNGCTASHTTQVTSSTSTVAINSFVASGTINCSQSSSATLTASLGKADRMPYSSTVVQPDGSIQTILEDGNPNPGYTVTQGGTYTLLVSDSNGCVSSTTTTVSSESSVPSVSVTPAMSTIQKGESVTLTASGADSYQWSTTEAGESITVQPQITTTISVTGTDRETGCFNVAQATIQIQTPRPLAATSPAINNPVLVLSSSNCPITFTGKGWGKSFVITSPDGYVFSNVFRDFIVGGDIVGKDIKKPGTYTVTVFGDEDQTPVSYQFEVTGTGCN